MRDDGRLAANHLAEAAVESPHPAARADVDVVEAALAERGRAPDVVGEVGIASVDQDVAGLQVGREAIDRLIDHRGGNHHPDRARRAQFRDELVDRPAAGGAVLLQRRNRGGIDVVDDARVPAAHEPAHHARSHPSEADHAELHLHAPVRAPRRA